MSLRTKIKQVPVLGPIAYDLYLRAFKNEGGILAIDRGPLKEMRWVQFMRTYNEGVVNGLVEPSVQRALAEHLKPGMTFFDVGANAGFFTLLGAKLVGAAGKVMAYEAHPETAKQCLAQVIENHLKNVDVVAAAISDKEGTAQFGDEGFSDMLSLKNPRGRTITVRTTTLDHEIKSRAPDVVKIDIEGAEIDALNGSHKMLSEIRPVLLVELHSDEIAVEYDRLMQRYSYETASLEGKPVSETNSRARFVISKPIDARRPNPSQ